MKIFAGTASGTRGLIEFPIPVSEEKLMIDLGRPGQVRWRPAGKIVVNLPRQGNHYLPMPPAASLMPVPGTDK
jgi:hypothetical protein